MWLQRLRSIHIRGYDGAAVCIRAFGRSGASPGTTPGAYASKSDASRATADESATAAACSATEHAAARQRHRYCQRRERCAQTWTGKAKCALAGSRRSSRLRGSVRGPLRTKASNGRRERVTSMLIERGGWHNDGDSGGRKQGRNRRLYGKAPHRSSRSRKRSSRRDFHSNPPLCTREIRNICKAARFVRCTGITAGRSLIECLGRNVVDC